MSKNDVVTFTAHLTVTIKRLTGYKQKVVLAAILEGKRYALQHGGQYKSYCFVDKSKCNKISPLKCVSSQISDVS